jgi:hypothetical protein
MDLSVYSIFKMPFVADTRCGFSQVSLNVSVIHEELSDFVDEEDKEYFGELDNEDGSVFYMYVEELENAYTNVLNGNPQTCPKFFDWLYDNYNSMDSWDDVEREVEALRIENDEARCEVCGKWGQSLDMDYDDDTGFHICCKEEEEDMSPPSPIPNPPSPSPPSPNLTYEERVEVLERRLSPSPERARSISPPHTVREPTPPPVYSPPTTKEVSTQTWIG